MTTGRINQVAIVVDPRARKRVGPGARAGETPTRPRNGEDVFCDRHRRAKGASRGERRPSFFEPSRRSPRTSKRSGEADPRAINAPRTTAPACRPTERENRPGKLQRTGPREAPKRPEGRPRASRGDQPAKVYDTRIAVRIA